MYKMIIFDCDGTLVDSSVMISMLEKGYHEMYPQRDTLPYEHFIPCYFQTNLENLSYLQVSEEEREKFEEICFHRHENGMRNVLPFDGINELILQLCDWGYELGIATSRSYAALHELKEQLDPRAYAAFSCFGVQDIVKHAKPQPDVLLYIMKYAHKTKSELLFVGDSINDALCAERAGVDFAWATWGMISKEQLPCKYQVHSPKELADMLCVTCR